MSANRSARSCSVSPWAAVAVAIAGLAAPAVVHAQAPPTNQFSMKTPAEWPKEPGIASGIAKQLAKSVDFGGAKQNGGAAAYVKQQTGVIYVTWLIAEEASAKPEEVVRTTLDQLRKSIGPGGAEVEYNETRVGPAVGVNAVSRHAANETLTMSRALVWKDTAGKLRLLRAECLFSESDRAAVAPICGSALQTLEATEITAGKAGELGPIAAPGGAVEDPAPGVDGVDGVDGGAAATPTRESPSIRAIDPSKPLYEGNPKKTSAVRDNLWLFIVGGVLIIFAFWAATRGRRQDEPEEAEAAASEPDDEAAATAASEEEE